ncbi:MAG: hypothetical protein QM628_16410 [Propionicimonas sp.]
MIRVRGLAARLAAAAVMIPVFVTLSGCADQGCGSGSASPEEAVRDLIEAVYSHQPEATICRYVQANGTQNAITLINSIRTDIDDVGGTSGLTIAVHTQVGGGWEVAVSTTEKEFGVLSVYLATSRSRYVLSSEPQFDPPLR